MIISKCAFGYSMASAKDYKPDGRTAIAIVGKSNVGKSSLINTYLPDFEIQTQEISKALAVPLTMSTEKHHLKTE